MNKHRLIEFFEDVDSSLSIKRLLTLFFGLLFGAALIGNMLFNLKVDALLINALIDIEIALIAGVTAEKFTKRGITSTEANDQKLLENTPCINCKN